MEDFFDIKQKFANNFIELGERFSYCISIKNISNKIITDLLYREKFNDNLKIVSIKLDGKRIKYEIDKNIILFEIEKINIQETKSILITMDVLEYIAQNEFNYWGVIEGKINFNNVIENIEQEIKNIEIPIVYHKLILTMISSLNEVVKGNIIDIVIIAENSGNVDIQNILVSNVLKSGLKFIENSVQIDDNIDEKANPNSEINIGDLKVGEFKIIKFKVKVDCKNNEKVIINKAIARYMYSSTSKAINKIASVASNIEKINVQLEDAEIILKVDKEELSLNSEVVYRVFISNIGTLDLYNLFFRKELGKEFEFVKNTLKINGELIELENLENGVLLGNLKPCDNLELLFKLKYVGGIENSFIENSFILDKDYKLKDKYILKGSSVIKSIKHFINISSFNQVIFDGEIILDKNNLPIKEVNNFNCNIDIKDYYYIDTFCGQSVDNQINTGKKLIVNGIIKLGLEYTSKNEEGSVHFIEDKHIVSSYVILPQYYNAKYKLFVNGKVEDATYMIESEKRVKVFVSILIIAKIILS